MTLAAWSIIGGASACGKEILFATHSARVSPTGSRK